MGGLGVCGALGQSKIVSLLAQEKGGAEPVAPQQSGSQQTGAVPGKSQPGVLAQSQLESLPGNPLLLLEDDQLLDDLEKRNFQFFWEQASPVNGLVRDRANVVTTETSVVASIAATGFGLTALCIAEQRGFISREEARERALVTLRFLWKKMPTHRGFFFHFADINTGERVWDSEVSSVDTAILLCGILMCRQHFEEHSEISLLAYEIFNRVDWSWLSEDTSVLPHGWTPEGGFLPYRWDYYSEMMMIYLLGLGSFTHPLPVQAWTAWKRTKFEFDGIRYIGSFAPLFVHQYSQAWFDFRGKRDAYADYFVNSALATDAHRLFCLELGKQFPDYSDDLWGISASDSQTGVCDLGWAADDGADRRDGGSERIGGIAGILAAAGDARHEKYSGSLRKSDEQVWVCECV